MKYTLYKIRPLLQSINKVISIVGFLSLFFYSCSANAALNLGLNAATMVVNIAGSVPNLMRLVTAIAYVMGFVFLLKGIMALKHVGESRTQMSREHSMREPLILLFVGAALLFLPSTIMYGTDTFWTDKSVFAYVTNDESPWSDFIQSVYMIVELIGVISVIRGLVMLAGLSHHGGGHQGGFGKAMAHLIAGIFCINLPLFLATIMNTLFYGQG